MRLPIARLVHWTPRILGLLFAAFVSVFALDALRAGHNAWQTIIDLAMNLIPAALVLGAVTVAWHWAWTGGLLFLALGAWYVIMAWGRFHWSAYAVIAGPLFLLGLLFEIDSWYTRLRTRRGSQV
jgi:hypothetical protein